MTLRSLIGQLLGWRQPEKQVFFQPRKIHPEKTTAAEQALPSVPTAHCSSEPVAEALYSAPIGASASVRISPDEDEVSTGLPKDWEFRREAVLKRDGRTCQAQGCFATTTKGDCPIDIHHIVPKSVAPSHRLENLVALCRVHHAIQHTGNRSIEVDTKRCTIVSRHWAQSKKTGLRWPVKMFIRRKIRITATELQMIRGLFKLRCHVCESREWEGHLIPNQKLIWTSCPGCNGRWEFELGLREETGTQMATSFEPMTSPRSFPFDPAMMEGIKAPVFYEGCPECRNCRRRGYLVIQKRGPYGHFKKCSEGRHVCTFTKGI